MDTLQRKLMDYRLELSQLREKKRSFETQATEAGQKAAIVEARIAGIQEAASLLGADIEAVPDDAKTRKKRQRALSGHWKEIMARVYRGGDTFSYGDLAAYADMIGHKVGSDTLRSQMSGYKSAGLVESLGNGTFRLTEAGKVAAGVVEERDTGHEDQERHDTSQKNEGWADGWQTTAQAIERGVFGTRRP